MSTHPARPPRPARPTDVALRLVEVAARLLAEEGEQAVTARRVTTDAGVSTMAVYTHFGSMDALFGAIWREGFARFSEELERPARTGDPVADFMTQGWGYRHFARREPHLYEVMFGTGLAALPTRSAEDAAAALDTFLSMTRRLERCMEQGRYTVDDPLLAGEVVWATVHGHTTIELSGYHGLIQRDPRTSYAECLLRLAIGFGDEPAAARRSLAAARRRARRAGQDA